MVTTMNDTKRDNNPSEDGKLGFVHILKSTLAGALGVQSDKNREQDFTKGSIKVYAVAGVIFTVLFIAVVITVVKVVLHNAGM